MRIAAFGFRSIPPVKGAAGADKFAIELLPRLVKRGHSVIAYNRQYNGVVISEIEYKGVQLKAIKTVSKTGFDTLLHSFKCTLDIIFNNTADIIHIQNGGNSIWALPLRIFGKKVFISQDGVDWKREKWPWYGKLYLKVSSVITAYFPNTIIFDNIIAKDLFEKKFHKKYEFIPFGSEVDDVKDDDTIFSKNLLLKKQYYLFVGRFIPDKGLHYLILAFLKAKTNKTLVLIGGTPNPSTYEHYLKNLSNNKVIFLGFIYGDDVIRLMKNAYCYIQPSDVEGLSPVILSIMALGTPLIVSDIDENVYAVQDTALKFQRGNINSLSDMINFAENNNIFINELSCKAKKRALKEFNWEKVTDEHLNVFSKY